MTHQSEAALEAKLIQQLVALGYTSVHITNEDELVANLKLQLEKHNQIILSQAEFNKVLNHLNKGNVFERAKILRDKMCLSLDNGEVMYLEFMNIQHWCQNIFQITSQISQEGSYQNRYDVTLLVNGLPLVQIELKRRGIELKEAFNQINRYQRHSFNANFALFNYVQIFVISNGVNSKYYANNRKQSFKQTFYWSDKENNNITGLDEFTNLFLEPCHISKMIARYTVLNETEKCLMILRPYQYYAVEAIEEQVRNNPKQNGYIWHTTGSGKTLTSFKTSQILTAIPKVHKVVFVVDRKDLDFQTIGEFNSFAKGSVDGTEDTRELVRQFSDPSTKLIVTTLQKLNVAITKQRHLSKMDELINKRIVFIFDECHRSQFGDTHKRIKEYFANSQMFGFTGTPIFEDNATDLRTTANLFDECLHKYVITDAIKDENVLKFAVEYIGRYTQKDSSKTYVDIDVEDIDTKELLEDPKRIGKIVNYIIANHDRKTHNRQFSAMFCVSNIDTLVKYYDLFKQAKLEGRHNLKIATIFSYGTNEDDADANGLIGDELDFSKHSRDSLDDYISDYNQTYSTNFSTKDTQSFYNYYTDLAKRVKYHAANPRETQVDILLVVNMFLTGFDSKTLNTLYVDKNLKYHGLIQAYSRTNRILNEVKSQGNIVCFRNLKAATDSAITLFSNKDAQEVIFTPPYEVHVAKFNQTLERLFTLVPTVDSVSQLATEHEEFTFIQIFRELLRIKNILVTFSDFNFNDVNITEQVFEDYKSKYLDLYDKVKSDKSKEKVSILNDVDFELELVHRDEINVSYIISLLMSLVSKKDQKEQRRQQEIQNLLGGEVKLRSKRQLIEKFINENIPHITNAEEIPQLFSQFWSEQQNLAFDLLCKDLQLDTAKLNELVDSYLYNEKKPQNEQIVDILIKKPKILERKKVIAETWDAIAEFIDTFIDGME